MKKLLVFILVLALMIPAAAENSAAPKPLEVEELNAWTQSLLERAISDKLQVLDTPEGLQAHGRGYSVFPASRDLSPDTLLLGAVIDGESIGVQGLTGPRVSLVTQAVEAILAAFPNDNPSLMGSEEAAVLYLRGAFPQPVLTGMVYRDGQNITLVEFAIFTPNTHSVDRSGIHFTAQDGFITAIRYFGAESVPMAEATQHLNDLAALQEEKAYFSFDTSNPSQMQREDLVFGVLDFLDLDPITAVGVFGEPVATETAEDSNGDRIEIVQWEPLNITFIYDKDGNFLRAQQATVHGMLEGPRGLRLGEGMLKVLYRFFNESETLNTAQVALYGDTENTREPYGVLLQDEGTGTLHYSVPMGEGSVLFSCLFLDEELVEMSFTRQ